MRKLFLSIAVFVMALCASAQKNQYFWYQGNLMLGNPIAQIDSVTFGAEDTDSILVYLPRTIIKTVEVHDTVFLPLVWKDWSENLFNGLKDSTMTYMHPNDAVLIPNKRIKIYGIKVNLDIASTVGTYNNALFNFIEDNQMALKFCGLSSAISHVHVLGTNADGTTIETTTSGTICIDYTSKPVYFWFCQENMLNNLKQCVQILIEDK